MRLNVWLKTSGSQKLMERNPALYSDLLKSQYQAEIVEIIKIDIPRTFPENIYFDKHKNELFNVLIAFAHQNYSVGYCQGLNYIAGLIIIVTKDEVATFWLLKHLVENIAPEYHSKTMLVPSVRGCSQNFNLLRKYALFEGIGGRLKLGMSFVNDA